MLIEKWIHAVDAFIWGPPLMFFLVVTGLILTVFFKCIQFRGFKHAVDVLRGKYDDPNDPGEISHFQALSAALSATIGTGNIVGVAAAILTGGPGAIFWMWITALVGMATKFTSCTLAVKFRQIDDRGEAFGGPMYFIEQGMGRNWKWLAVVYAGLTVIASFGIGNMFQSNSIVSSLRNILAPDSTGMGFNIVFGVVVALLVGFVILGGIKSIGLFASRIVPFMTVFYVGAGLIILIKNATDIPAAFSSIFYHAFHTPEAISGGLLGTVIKSGVARGLFSNEAGLGSAAMAHGAAKTKEPVREGLVAMLGPFIDTIVICSITALVIIITDTHASVTNKTLLTSKAFANGLGVGWGDKIVSLGIILFAFSTLISWSYYGDRAASYLFGPKAIPFYRIVYCLVIVLGALGTIEAVINFSDAANGLMAIPNLIALLVLSPQVAKMVQAYFAD